MNDRELIMLVAKYIGAAIENAGPIWAGIEVLQKNQPTQQGQPTASAVYVEKLFDTHYGWPMTSLQYIEASDKFDDKSTQLVETTVQISAVVKEEPEVVRPTGSDVANYLCNYFNHPTVVRQIRAEPNDAALLRVTSVRNPYQEDDRTQYQSYPSFDVVFTHNRSLVLSVPAVHECVPGTVEGFTGSGTFPVPDAVA